LAKALDKSSTDRGNGTVKSKLFAVIAMKTIESVCAVLMLSAMVGASALGDEVDQVKKDIVGKWKNLEGGTILGPIYKQKDKLDYRPKLTSEEGEVIYIFHADGTYEYDISEAAKHSKEPLTQDEFVKAKGRYEVRKGEKYVAVVTRQEEPFADTFTHDTVRVYKRDGMTILDFGLGNPHLQFKKVEK
jgi:hypothetical protein